MLGVMSAEKKKGMSEEKSVGMAISDWQRERSNNYSDSKREELLKKGLARIYGANKQSAVTDVRRT
jgi:hypothetical protein